MPRWAYSRLLLALTIAAPGHAWGATSAPRHYETSFIGAESPLSENGAWRHFGQDWTIVESAGGLAYGTQKGVGLYDDSYAYLTGFSADQSASAIVHLDPAISSSTSHEVEILLRWADSAHMARGYECTFSYDGGYVQIVRWNGARGDFTYLAGGTAPGGGNVPGGIHNGDTVGARIVGRRITAYVNGLEVAAADDATWATGDPGIGFWRGSASSLSPGDFAFTSYSANSLPAVGAPIALGWWLAVALGQMGIGILVLRGLERGRERAGSAGCLSYAAAPFLPPVESRGSSVR